MLRFSSDERRLEVIVSNKHGASNYETFQEGVTPVQEFTSLAIRPEEAGARLRLGRPVRGHANNPAALPASVPATSRETLQPESSPEKNHSDS